MTSRSAPAVLLAALLALAGCDTEGPSTTPVQPLSVPSETDRGVDQRVQRADELLAAGDERLAIAELRALLRDRPDELQASRRLVRLLMDQRRHAEALPVLERVVTEPEIEPEFLALHVTCLEELGRYEEALAAAGAWADAHGRDAEAQFRTGRLAYLVGDLDRALGALRRAERLQAGRSEVRSELGLVLLQLGKRDEAEAKQRDAIARDPKSALAWFRLGDVVSRAGPERRREAIRAMERSLELDDRGADALATRLFLYRLYRLQEAGATADDGPRSSDELWRELLARLTPRHTRVGGGGSDTGAGDLPELQRAARDAPEDDPKPLLALARELHRQGRSEAAARLYDDAFRRLAEPPSVELVIEVGATLASVDPGAALIRLEEAVRRAPDDARARQTLGWTFLLLDRVDDAEAAFERALASTDDARLIARIRRARGLAWMRRGHLDEGLAEIAAAGWF